MIALSATPPPARPSERWETGDAYEAYMGRWSRLVAADFVEWLHISPGGVWLDVGCGTGALTGAICEISPGRMVAMHAQGKWLFATSSTLEEAYLGYRAELAGEWALETSLGSRPLRLGSGMLISNGGADGFDRVYEMVERSCRALLDEIGRERSAADEG